jgi:predicted PurR-regulated permease PerM
MAKDKKGHTSPFGEYRGTVPPDAVVPPSSPADQAALRPEHIYKAIGLAFFAAVAYRFFDELSRVLLTVYAAAILGIAFNSVVGLFPRQRRWVTAALGLAVLAAIGVSLWLGIPALAEQLRGITERAPEFQRTLQEISAWIREKTGLNVQLAGPGLRRSIDRFISDVGSGEIVGRARGLLDVIIFPLLVLVGGLYAVGKPNDRLLTPFLRAVPRYHRLAFRRVLELLALRIRMWVVGSLLSMLAVGILTTGALYLVGAPYALFLGTLNGVLEFVPVVGPWVGGFIAVAVTFLESPSLALWVLVVVIAVQQVESNLITPLVMAKAAEVHPFITVFAIFLFGSLFGFLGILLALPLVLLIWTTVEVLWVERAIDTDQDPIDPVVEE